MNRYIMSLEEAVDLVLFAFEHGQNGDILVQKEPACTIQTQAEAVADSLPTNGGRRFLTLSKGAPRTLLRSSASATIQIYNYGNCRRDYTYVDDIVEGIVRVMRKAQEKKNDEGGLPNPPYAVYNIGSGQPESLLDFVKILQEELVRAGVLSKDYDFEAHNEIVPMQPGDIPTTMPMGLHLNGISVLRRRLR